MEVENWNIDELRTMAEWRDIIDDVVEMLTQLGAVD